MKKLLTICTTLFLLLACEKIAPEYPDEPVVDYQGFGLFIATDALGNKNLVGKLSFKFTDGDGNIGLPDPQDTSEVSLPDTLRYNLFLHLYDLDGNEYVQIPEEQGGILKYRIPVLDKNPTSGTLDLDIAYPVIIHDTIFYTFYIYDRDLNRSNIDTTEVIVLSGINLDEI